MDTASTAQQPSAAWRVIGLFARLLVGGLFVYAAYNKIADPGTFAEQIRDYRAAPLFVTNAIALTLPWIELFAGAMLIVGIWRREARLIIATLLVGFTGLKIWAELAGLEIGCGCFGNDWMEKTFAGWWGVGLNIGMLALLWIDATSVPAKKPAAAAASPDNSAAPKAAPAS